MADQPQTPSGSRWEPDPAEVPIETHPAETEAADHSADQPADHSADPATDARRTQLRGRAILAGAATALTLGGALTGFVIGHSTAGDGNDGFSPANFSRQGPGDGRQFGGQVPPDFDGDGDGPGSNSSGSSGNPT